MPGRCLLVHVVLLALALGLLNPALAGEPTDQLRSEIDQLFRVLTQSPASKSGEREAAEIMDRMFDWARMSEATLRGHWRQRTPSERGEFTRLFTELFQRAYVSRINVVDASKFRYLGDTIDGNRAVVKTQVFTARGSAIDVDYAVRLADNGRWRVEDVLVERVSLVENYRTQFDAFIARSSYETLVTRLRGAAKVE